MQKSFLCAVAIAGFLGAAAMGRGQKDPPLTDHAKAAKAAKGSGAQSPISSSEAPHRTRVRDFSEAQFPQGTPRQSGAPR